jgi:beta-N-acetylhexosaminidase
MTLREKVGQLVIAPCYGEDPSSRSKDFREFVHLVRDLHIGGFVVINRVTGGTVRNAEPHAMASFLNRMQRLAKVPLLAAGDFERGASMRVSGTAKFPHLMAYGAAHDPELTKQLGAATAKESRALGIQWVFAPDTDVNNNPDNPIINTRSFGEDPAAVARQVSAFIAGAHSDPAHRVLVTAKHFPGHGDTSVDSHMGLPVLEAARDRIESMEFVPFRAAVTAGVDAIMSAHMSVPALDPAGVPATVSSKILTGVVRDELNFQGLVVTDAMNMQGLTSQFSPGEAAVRAIAAGADVLLMPPDPDAAIKGVLAAVQQGRLTQKRIDQSVQRILAAKARVGLHRSKLVNLEKISDVIESQEMADAAQLAADRAVTLVKNEKNSVPLKSPKSTCVWVLAASRNGQGGRTFLEEIRQRSNEIRTTQLDPLMSQIEIDAALAKTSDCETQVVAAFVSTGAYKGAASLGGNYPALMEALGKGPAPVVLIALGSPYLLRAFPEVSSFMATFSPVQTSEIAAVKALLGEMPITGTLPVTIPGLAKIGDGIMIGSPQPVNTQAR